MVLSIKMELSTEQNIALEAFKNGDNVFLTGPGGSGKTALIKYMIQNAEEREKEAQVCALTGCAAVLLGCKGAKTLHSWAGVGLANGDVFDVVDRVARQKHRRKPWEKTEILIIDEVSMMSIKLFEILDRIGRRVRKNPGLPFGGIQVIFSGDFYQLPPVGANDAPETSAFCFESPFWETTFNHSVQLTKIFRQTDQVYTKILNQVRTGRISKSSCQHLHNRVKVFGDTPNPVLTVGDTPNPVLTVGDTPNPVLTVGDTPNPVLTVGDTPNPVLTVGDTPNPVLTVGDTPNPILSVGDTPNPEEKTCRPTILLPTRRQVDMINNAELKKLTPDEVEFNHTFHDDLNGKDAKQRFSTTITPEQQKKELENLSNSIMADKKLVLKVGAQVMCVANIDMEGEFPIINGSLGVVTKFVGDAPLVKFHDGQARIMTPHTWESDNIPGIGVKQIPLILAWAITIHKAQGVTLDLAQIDAGRSIFECGQTYVALSRVKSLEGLYLTSFQPEKIKINRKVRDFYRKLDEYTKTIDNSRIELDEKKYQSAAALRKEVEKKQEYTMKSNIKKKPKTTTSICISQKKNIQSYFNTKAAT